MIQSKVCNTSIKDIEFNLHNYDVSASINLMDSHEVQNEVRQILRQRFSGEDLNIIDEAFDHFRSCYAGNHPSYYQVETRYHDVQHVMDVSLAMLRLIEGYFMRQESKLLTFEQVLVALIVALFHDSGYLRDRSDHARKHGAEHTSQHVSRSGVFIKDFLLDTTLEKYTDIAVILVQFTGIEKSIENLQFHESHSENQQWLMLGYMVGTADLIAQMSDRNYAQRCQTYLYEELFIAGLTEITQENGESKVLYANGKELLIKTPDFIKETVETRLKKSFHSVFEYAAVYFGGRNLYLEGIENNRLNILTLLAE